MLLPLLFHLNERLFFLLETFLSYNAELTGLVKMACSLP